MNQNYKDFQEYTFLFYTQILYQSLNSAVIKQYVDKACIFPLNSQLTLELPSLQVHVKE